LLFERRGGIGRKRAVTAATAYLEAARSCPQADLAVAQSLVRAWELARRMRAWALLADVCTEVRRLAAGRSARVIR
jgi:Flp pilus assembly protein TadD